MKLSSFTVIMTFVILMTVGIALAPLIDVGTDPQPRQGKSMTISYEWSGMPAKTVEQNLTSPVEGMLAALNGVEKTSSRSYFGRSEIVVQLKDGADVSAIRFEISSILRQTYGKLPNGVEFPEISGGEVAAGENGNSRILLLTYTVNAGMREDAMKSVIESMVARPLKETDGVTDVEVTGTTGSYIDITYNPYKLAAIGMTAQDMADGIANYIGKDENVGTVLRPVSDGSRERITVRLNTSMPHTDIGNIPLKNISGKMVYLNDLADVRTRKRDPDSYYRVNGLNTVYLNVYIPADGKVVAMSDRVQEEMADAVHQLRANRQNIGLRLTYDCAKQQRQEMAKLVGRTLLSLAILLALVWLSYRDWRYLAIIALSLAANILIAIIAYWMFGLKLHVYSLAGITMSLGLVIDSTIVMADHYGYYHNRKAFLSILAAMLTTVSSMLIVLFLPKELRDDLYDFAWIVIINLIVSLLVAFFFVPAIMDRCHYSSRQRRLRHGRMVARWNRIYLKYICAASRHRWVCVVLLVVAFGFPFASLPDRIGMSDDYMTLDRRDGHAMPWYCSVYNATIGSRFFQSKCKRPLDKWLGGTVSMFVAYLNEGGSGKDKGEKELHIIGRMPAGSSAVQLNPKMAAIEDILKGHKGISEFTTRIDGRYGEIVVKFDKDAVGTSLPFVLENEVIGKMITIGGADWSTYGVSQRGFSNAVDLQFRSQSITLSGYNYDQLLRTAGNIADSMALNKRVQDIKIETPEASNQEDEIYVQYDRERMALAKVSPGSIHNRLYDMLTTAGAGTYRHAGAETEVTIRPSTAGTFDQWHLENEQITADSTSMFVPDMMSVRRREAKNIIPKNNQEYVLNIAFNVLGTESYTSELIDNTIKKANMQMPVGYHCTRTTYGSAVEEGASYWLLLLVVVFVFFICAIQFESLRMSAVIVSVIPLSMIGSFLTFCLTRVQFGSGGFASMVLLIGITVNSGIYIISQYRLCARQCKDWRKAYIKAYSHKIIPVVLTIASTIMGLVPFFIDGTDEPFWFSFATGVTGGLLFSLPAIIFVMPVFVDRK